MAAAANRTETDADLERVLIVALDLEAQVGAWVGVLRGVDPGEWRGPAARAHATATEGLAARLRAAEGLLTETAHAVRLALAAADG